MRRLLTLLISAMLVTVFNYPAGAATKVFYLDMQRGCYSGTPLATKPLQWSSPTYKTLYSRSCNTAHHYEVYYLGKLTTSLSNDKASQQQANDRCSTAAENYLAGANFSDILTIGWFFPDAGAEERKYGKKLICFFRFANESTWQSSEVVTRPARQSA